MAHTFPLQLSFHLSSYLLLFPANILLQGPWAGPVHQELDTPLTGGHGAREEIQNTIILANTLFFSSYCILVIPKVGKKSTNLSLRNVKEPEK